MLIEHEMLLRMNGRFAPEADLPQMSLLTDPKRHALDLFGD